MYKPLDSIVRKQKEEEKRARAKDAGYKRKKKEGMDFEKRVARSYNQASSNRNDVARRRPNSGAFWNMPGDIALRDALLECKQRGTTTSKGEKTITIHLEWLQKIGKESVLAKKEYWALPFNFKGSEEIFLVKSFEQELAMIEQIEILKQRIEELSNGDNGRDERTS